VASLRREPFSAAAHTVDAPTQNLRLRVADPPGLKARVSICLRSTVKKLALRRPQRALQSIRPEILQNL
jgi:hypothetical protein